MVFAFSYCIVWTSQTLLDKQKLNLDNFYAVGFRNLGSDEK